MRIGHGTHPLNYLTTSPYLYLDRLEYKTDKTPSHNEWEELAPVHIGNDVWIGDDVWIKNGITVGDGAVIGAHAVVTHDVPPYAIVAGNPAKVLRYRFSQDIIIKMENFKWWKLDDITIKKIPYDNIKKSLEFLGNVRKSKEALTSSNNLIKVNVKKENKMITKKILSSLVVAIIAIVTAQSLLRQDGIKVTFSANASKDIKYQVFYTPEADGIFNEHQSVKQLVPSGYTDVKIMLPTEKIARFRLDFGELPERVIISDIKIIGDKTITIKDFNNYRYNKIEKHDINNDGSLTIESNQNDPFMITNDKLDINETTFIDWFNVCLIGLSCFIITYLLAILFSKNK